MPPEGKAGLTIDKETWKELSNIKLEKDFKTLGDVIIYLLKEHKKGVTKNAKS